MFIFKRTTNSEDGIFRYKLYKRIRLVEIPGFEKVCMTFYFKNTEGGKEPDTLIFARKEKIIEFNFENLSITDKCSFEVQLT